MSPSAPPAGTPVARPTTRPPVVEFVTVSKSFGDTRAVDRVSFALHSGEFFSILGPSGCGKTTTLRLLAGFEAPDDDGGEVRIEGEVVNHRRPYQRRLGMVFQSYALFPHMSVAANVAFGLEQRATPADEIAERVARALEMVRLEPGPFARRMPASLSGGERQRVALARALVLEPPILLLDEPLGAIDLKLRKAMQLELRTLNRELGITFLYVTHDQEEALTMSDRIAVMDHARIAQIGTPAEIYENPRTAFVAQFIGDCNLFDGVVEGPAGAGWAVTASSGLVAGGRFTVPSGAGLAPGGAVRIAVRPEWMDLFPPDAVPARENRVDGTVREVFYRGETVHVVVAAGGGGDRPVVVALRNEGQLVRPLPWRPGDPVAACWQPEDCQVLEAE